MQPQIGRFQGHFVSRRSTVSSMTPGPLTLSFVRELCQLIKSMPLGSNLETYYSYMTAYLRMDMISYFNVYRDNIAKYVIKNVLSKMTFGGKIAFCFFRPLFLQRTIPIDPKD